MDLINNTPPHKKILFALLFFWMFPPVLKLFPGVVFQTNLIIISIPAFLGLVGYFKYKRQSRVSNTVLILMILGFVYILMYEFIGVLIGVIDFNFTKEYVMGFMLFFSAYYIVSQYKFYYGNKFLEVLLIHMFYIGAIHSFLILSVAFFANFKELFYEVIWLTGRQEKYTFGDVFNHRYSGLLSTGLSSLSTTHATLLSIGLFCLHRVGDFKFIKLMLFAASSVGIFLSLIFIGRSGFVVLGMYMLVFSCLYLYNFIINLKVSYFSVKVFIFAVLAVLLSISAFDSEKYTSELASSFDFMIRFIETGVIREASIDGILESHLIFPSDPFGLLFGTANFGRGSMPIPSDLGVVYLVNGIGIVGTLFVFSCFFILLYYAYLFKKDFKLMFYFILVFEILLIVLNFKDLYFLGFTGFSKIFFIFTFMYHFIYLERVTYEKESRKVKLHG